MFLSISLSESIYNIDKYINILLLIDLTGIAILLSVYARTQNLNRISTHYIV